MSIGAREAFELAVVNINPSVYVDHWITSIDIDIENACRQGQFFVEYDLDQLGSDESRVLYHHYQTLGYHVVNYEWKTLRIIW